MEPLSIIIDVENYKIGIDASPKRAVDYSIRHKLKRPVVEISGPTPKVIRIEAERKPVEKYERRSPEKISAFKRVPEKKLTVPESIPTPLERPGFDRVIKSEIPRTVISHTAISLAQSSSVKKEMVIEKVEVKEEADISSKSPTQGTSGTSSTEMWRPW